VTFTIEILRSAQKQLSKIQRQDRQRITEAILALSHNPRPSASKKLTARPAWRIRVGVYRIIYEIYDDRLLVLVVTIGHRKEAYRLLP
jgi:mRNA interferase RelE/StbE